MLTTVFVNFLWAFKSSRMSGVVFIVQPERVIPSQDNKGFGVTSDVWSFGITMVITWHLICICTSKVTLVLLVG